MKLDYGHIDHHAVLDQCVYYISLALSLTGISFILDATEAEKLAKVEARRDKALATIVLSVETSLLYLLGDPEDPVIV